MWPWVSPIQQLQNAMTSWEFGADTFAPEVMDYPYK